MQAKAAITVNRPVHGVYEFWRDLTRLPEFMIHLKRVEAIGPGRTRWRASGPAGRSVSWEAQTVEDVPDQLIAWRSVEGAGVTNSGTVRFTPAPGRRGTEVRVDLDYRPPGGVAGAAVAKLFGESPRQQVEDDLRRFKQVIETGEVLRSEGSPEGTRALRQAVQRPSQPQD